MKTALNKFSTFFFILCSSFYTIGCSVQKQISKTAENIFFADTSLAKAHTGICLFDADAQQFLYNYQSNKYFIPASNTKIFTCYAGMKYLGDSLIAAGILQTDSVLYVFPSGDPTFLHTDFAQQPLLKALQQNLPVTLIDTVWNETPLGVGWAWDDYNDDYSAERSAFPIYGNTMRFSGNKSMFNSLPSRFTVKIITAKNNYLSFVKRNLSSNSFDIAFNGTTAKEIYTPFLTQNGITNAQLLSDTLHVPVKIIHSNISFNQNAVRTIYSQPVDTLLRIMMHRSDNFYAEQSLLMLSNKKLEVMNDEEIINTLLNNDLKGLPQKPQWVDGSGLSRFNLFSPQDFVFILNKMKSEFSWQRITTIFETGGQGTIANYYKNMQGKIFAKTGSLSNNIAFSGYLITHKNKIIIFSVLVNNHTAHAAAIRKATEKFLTTIAEKY